MCYNTFDHVDVINGQGTSGIECIEQLEEKHSDIVLCCCGGWFDRWCGYSN